MNSNRQLLIGIAESGIMHTCAGEFDVDTRFRMVKEAGVFDYVEKSPFLPDIPAYRAAVERHGIPILAGIFYYVLKRDEPLLQWHLNVCRDFGSLVHNIQIMTYDAEGGPVSDEQVADAYCQALEWGEAAGVVPCFEVHVNMWSEHFGRVQQVAEIVRARGYQFNITLDHSHVIFKIDNPVEQAVQDMCEDVESGKLILDPFAAGNVCANWIDANYVRHAHARAAAPGGPTNSWASHPDGSPGRGIQYPFIEPGANQWHAEWHAQALEPWKEVMRYLLRHHALNKESRLQSISTEFIASVDYGAGAGYSIFDNNVACAEWLRNEWQAAQQQAAGQA